MAPKASSTRPKCPYLDTVNRTYLDFDFEKLCSVSLSNMNIYVCLVCGKFFQGRGPRTHAHTHSLHDFHHVFMNLHTARIFCLPDNYEVLDSSLDDIKRALFPSFTSAAIAQLDTNTTLVRDVHGVSYLPGFVGLNNLKSTDYVNVVLQALGHVTPLRNYFLQPSLYEAGAKNQLVLRFGEVMRKLWSQDNFKSTVSPHDFLQEVVSASGKRFAIGKPGEAVDFLSWLLHQLHVGLGGTMPMVGCKGGEGGKKKKAGRRSVVLDCFQGEIRVRTLTKARRDWTVGGRGEEEGDEDDGTGRGNGAQEEKEGEPAGEWAVSETRSPFLFLTVDIPQTPLFKDSQGGVIIPHIPLYSVLDKFNGVKVVDAVKAGVHTRKQYWITRLPQYLILSLARLTRNHFFVEKNPTIVNFPVKNLELRDYFLPEAGLPTEEGLKTMTVGELKGFVQAHGGGDAKEAVEREDLEEQARAVLNEVAGTKYDLVANVVHDSPPGQEKKEAARGEATPPGTYRVHVFNRASDQWYEIQDLHVQETLPQLITISESCVLIYEKKGVERARGCGRGH